jgi:hypothetical protein
MPKPISTTIPPNCVFRFEGKVRKEGKTGLRMTIPASVIRGLRHLNWNGEWLDVALPAGRWMARTRTQGASMIVALPAWCRGETGIGDRVAVEIQDPGRFRCEPDPLISGSRAAREQVTNGIPSPRDRVALVLPVYERENLSYQGVSFVDRRNKRPSRYRKGYRNGRCRSKGTLRNP